MGMEAATMVMADSAAARMTSCVVASVKVALEMDGNWVILTIEVMPALRGNVSIYLPGQALSRT